MEKAKVYFTKEITPENIVKMYEILNKPLTGKVAVKLHSGERGNQNYIRPEMVKKLVEHEKLMEEHGWTKYFDVDIMDAEGSDKVLEIPNGKVIKKNYVGKNIDNYNSMLVLSHFKGHPMGGYGGALKQLSIGVASSFGKAYIHGAGNPEEIWSADQIKFLEAMADSASSITKKFEGNIVYINVMCNMSVDCDCCSVAEDPCIKDIGILASLDPVAIDRACIDLVEKSDDPGKNHLLERINSRHGTHTIDAAADLGIGIKEYELINID